MNIVVVNAITASMQSRMLQFALLPSVRVAVVLGQAEPAAEGGIAQPLWPSTLDSMYQTGPGTTDPDFLAAVATSGAGAAQADPGSSATASDSVNHVAVPGVVNEHHSFTDKGSDGPVAPAGQLQPTTAETVIMATGVPSLFQKTLKAHNVLRTAHRAPELTWNETIASAAADWTSRCIWQAALPAGYGGSVWWSAAKNRTEDALSSALTSAIATWYGEVLNYNFNTPRLSISTRRFTNIVWNSSNKFGCDVRVCNTGLGGSGGTLVACMYDPHGNVAPVSLNVFPPKETTLYETSSIISPSCLNSTNKAYKLCMQSNGYLVLFNSTDKGSWASTPRSIPPSRQYRAVLMNTGQLALVANGNRYWVANTGSPERPHRLVVQDDGNVVIYNGQGDSIWATNTAGR